MRHAVATSTLCALCIGFALHAVAAQTGLAGAGVPVSNMQPSLAMSYITRLEGTQDQLGEVVPFAGSFAPAGWAFANGQIFPIDQNEALFQQLGATYGGDGVSTFALPDLRGRTPIHRGTGNGLTNRTLGSDFGAEEATLTASQMPAHHHTLAEGGATGSTGGPGQPFSNLQPSLGMNYGVGLSGNFPTEGVATSPTWFGQVRLFARNVLPANFAPADGQLLSLSQNTSLFAILGDRYGGDGQVTLGLPDLRGRVAMHVGSAAGGAEHELASTTGAEDVALAAANLPSHAHSLPAPATQTDPTGAGQPFDNLQPSMALNYLVCVGGNFPSPGLGADEPFLGQLTLFGGDFAPRNWALADGQLLPISQNTALFAILGTTYGGNGVTTFALPDLRGRVVIGAGMGAGLSDRSLGEELGSEATMLTADNLPPHAHSFTVYNADFDEDGDIDGADFLRWQTGVGTSTGALRANGDANADGDVDSFDLAVWRTQFGAPPPPPGAPVPEPATACLAALAAAVCARHRCVAARR